VALITSSSTGRLRSKVRERVSARMVSTLWRTTTCGRRAQRRRRAIPTTAVPGDAGLADIERVAWPGFRPAAVWVL
jgi:hypothetical protein